MIGVAGDANHAWLQSHGMIPVTYGVGVADRIRAAAQKVDALIDTRGGDYVEIALNEFGVQSATVDTIVRFDAVEKYWVKAEGNAAAPAPRRCELAELVAKGELEVPVAPSTCLTRPARRTSGSEPATSAARSP